MTTDLTVAPTRGGLESLTPAQRDAAVTRYLEDAHARLALALEATAVDIVRSIKAEASVMAELSRQVNVSKEVQADAAEMVRRAEWALGKAVKAGQARGEVNARGGDKTKLPAGSLPVNDFVKPGREHHDISTMASVEADDFEAALTEARAEGNVSRANVVRKVKERGGDKPRQAPRRPLTDAANDAAWNLRKAVEKAERIVADDRLAANKEQVTLAMRGHLLYAIEACQRLNDQLED